MRYIYKYFSVGGADPRSDYGKGYDGIDWGSKCKHTSREVLPGVPLKDVCVDCGEELDPPTFEEIDKILEEANKKDGEL